MRSLASNSTVCTTLLRRKAPQSRVVFVTTTPGENSNDLNGRNENFDALVFFSPDNSIFTQSILHMYPNVQQLALSLCFCGLWRALGCKYVALKVQKSADHYTEAARDEIDLLQTVRANAEALKELASKDPV